MKRIALLTAAFAVPMVSFAEVVVYAANHAGLPGHALAQRVVSAFAKKPTSRHDSPTSEPASRVTSELTDGRLPRPLNATKAVATESITVAPAPTPTTSAVTPAPRTPSIPNRALIAELTRQHHPELVRGDSSAEYVVMVLDAADGYVWSTSGNGNVGIEVGSDSRSIRDRAAFTYEYRDEFWGDVSSRAAARGGNMNGGFGAGAGGRARGGGGGVMRIDSLAGAGGGRGGGGGRGSIGPDSAARAAKRSARGGAGVNMRITRGDTIYTLRYDSLFVYFSRPDGVIGQGAIARETLRGGFGGGRGRGGFEPRTTTSVSGGYRAGWTGNAAGVLLNRALGLEPPTAERSGVQGLAPSFVESADTYFFAPREISSSNLRVMVIHLTPNATWRGPS